MEAMAKPMTIHVPAGQRSRLGAGRFAGRGDERGVAAVGIHEVRGHVVFSLDRMVAAEVTESGYALRHAADPLKKIQVVQALVQ